MGSHIREVCVCVADRRANARQPAQETAAPVGVRGDADPYEHVYIYIVVMSGRSQRQSKCRNRAGRGESPR